MIAFDLGWHGMTGATFPATFSARRRGYGPMVPGVMAIPTQSSWCPLYDRNPQRFVPNIYTARLSDYVKAKQRIYASPHYPSRIEMPLMP